MLYGAVRNLRPEVVVELGTGGGYSTAWMLLGLEENQAGHIWSCDLIPSDNPLWLQAQLPSTRLTYFSNDPVDSLQNKLPSEFDLVFHDAGHSLDEVKKDLEWILPRLKAGSCLVLHNLTFSLELGAWVSERFESDPEHFKLEKIEEGCGCAIIACIKKLENEQTCKDESSGSMTQKAMASSQVKMVKTTSPTIRKSKISKVGVPSRKIKTLSSNQRLNRKGQGPKLSRSEHPAEVRGATFG